MTGTSAKLLVVSNPEESAEICAPLVDSGFQVLATGDGSDETLALYERVRPDIVIVRANLDRGDARALAAAIRERDRGDAVKIILVGDNEGPIRNALDAVGFGVDRFVGQPLSAKALTFAVRLCARRVAARDNGAHRATGDGDVAEAHGRATPGDRQGAPVATASEKNSAIADFVSDATATLDTLGWRQKAQRQDSGWDEVPAPPREPTLVLSGAAGGDPPAGPPRAGAAGGQSRSRGKSGNAAGARGVHESGVSRPNAAGEQARESIPSADAIGAKPPPGRGEPDSGGAFAEELRRKMSQMAARLFPDQVSAQGGDLLDLQLAHDHLTEIDLESLGADKLPRPGDSDRLFYAELGNAATITGAPVPAAHQRREVSADVASEPGAATTNQDGVTPRHHIVPTDAQGRGELSLGSCDVATLLARLYAGAFTGKVIFARPPAEKAVYFDAGRPVFATSNLPHDRMGDLLYREGKITRAQYDRSRELVAESGRRMGEVLVEEGFLKRRELLPAVRRHIEDIVYSLFAWNSGEYRVFPGETTASEKIRLSRHPAAIILEGLRRKYGTSTLEACFGSISTIIELDSPKQVNAILSVADLSRSERDAIAAFDGRRSIEEAVQVAGISPVLGHQLAFGLVVLQAARVVVYGEDMEVEVGAVRPPSLVGKTDLAIDRQRVLAKHALVGEADYFTLLGVRRDSTSFEIKRAYEAARRDYAGDSFPVEVRKELEAQIGEINELLDEAYRVLKSDELRAAYLANLSE